MPRSFLVKSKKSYNVHRPIDTEQSEQKLPDPAPKTSMALLYFSNTELILKYLFYFQLDFQIDLCAYDAVFMRGTIYM